jgi:hypothetical protein
MTENEFWACFRENWVYKFGHSCDISFTSSVQKSGSHQAKPRIVFRETNQSNTRFLWRRQCRNQSTNQTVPYQHGNSSAQESINQTIRHLVIN